MGALWLCPRWDGHCGGGGLPPPPPRHNVCEHTVQERGGDRGYGSMDTRSLPSGIVDDQQLGSGRRKDFTAASLSQTCCLSFRSVTRNSDAIRTVGSVNCCPPW